jgi:hypothetical protein
MFNSNSLKFYSVAFALFALTSFAQDYPYDDVELKKNDSSTSETEEPADTTPNTNQIKIPSEPTKTNRRRNPALFRIGLKAGGSFTFLQNPDPFNPLLTQQYSGLGLEGALALGWDLPYQPIFIELEMGYRSLLMTAGEGIPPLHVIPLSLGIHYRNRLSKNSLWKPGFRSSLDIRIAEDSDNPGSNTFGIFPAVSVVSTFEIENFVIEPLFTISELQSQNNFITVAMRMGFRF